MSKSKKVIKNQPWGYKSCNELFISYIKPRFKKLKKSVDIGDYYDYIGGVGIYHNWKYSEEDVKNGTIPKEVEVIYQIWNNIKHWSLDGRKRTAYVSKEYLSVFLCNNNAKKWSDQGKWCDEEMGHWSDFECQNESAELPWKVKINYKDCTEEVIYIYEACLRAYEEIKKGLDVMQ